jgi:hypothetical protein
MLELLNLKLADPLSGELEMKSSLEGDSIQQGSMAKTMLHRNVLSGGGIDSVVLDPNATGCDVCATVSDGKSERAFAIARWVESGRLAWVRGSLSSSITHAPLPVPDDPSTRFLAESLMRPMLARFDYRILVDKPMLATPNPLILVARSNNGFFLSGYCPSTNATLRFRFPHGAPLLVGYETVLENGQAIYHMPRAWHRECRFLVEQGDGGEISCVERTHEEIGLRRRVGVSGLNAATVHFYPEQRPAGTAVRMENQGKRIQYETPDGGRRLVARNLTGDLVVSW